MTKFKSRTVLTLLALVLALSGLANQQSYAQKTSKAQIGGVADDRRTMRTLMIIDGSGSMWGSIRGQNKIVTVRKTLPKVLSAYEGKMTLGIMSYGHRRKGSCTDIELLTRPKPYKASEHGVVLSRLRARGKTPIASALERAAKVLPARGLNNHIILIADGTENCRRDPCAVAAKLGARNPGLRIHVIAFGVSRSKEKEFAKLRCIADNTNGEFSQAYLRRELHDKTKALFAKLWQREERITNRILVENKMKPGLYLRSVLASGSRALREGLKWEIYQGADKPLAGRAPDLSPVQKDKRLFVEGLENGDYYVQAKYKGLTTGVALRVTDARVQELDLVFNAAKISLGTFKFNGGPAIKNAKYVLYKRDKVSKKDALYGQINAKRDEIFLPAGQYRFDVKVKNLELSKRLSVQPGKVENIAFYLNGGKITLRTRLTSNAPALKNVEYTILRKSEIPERPNIVSLRTRAAEPELELPAARYDVDVRAGLARKTIPVQIVAGKESEVSIDLSAGRLKLISQPVSKKQLNSYKLYNGDIETGIEVTGPALFETSRSDFWMVVPYGRYRIVGTSGASTVDRTVLINANTPEQEVTFTHLADDLLLELHNEQRRRLARNVFWKIKDANGQTVFRSSLASPSVRLGRGNYEVTAYYRKHTISKQIQVSGGVEQSITLHVK